MKERKSAVEQLKEAIYSRVSSPKVDPEARSPLAPSHEKVPHTWEIPADIKPPAPVESKNLPPESPIQSEPTLPPAPPKIPPVSYKPPSLPNQPQKNTGSRKFLLSAILFFVAALGIVAWTIIGGTNTISPQNIDVSIIVPALVDSGKANTVQFVIANRTQTRLLAVEIIVDYPEGTRNSSDPTKSLTHALITAGDLEPGAQTQKTSSVIFFGTEGARESVRATIEYQIAGSNAVFTKQSEATFVIGSAPISLAVNAPSEVIAGQQFDTTLTVVANSINPITDVSVEAQYPFGFSVQNTNPTAGAGNTMWRLGTLKPGESRTIHIIGTLSGEDGDTRIFHFLSGSESDPTNIHVTVPIIAEPYSMTLRRPFVSATFATSDGKVGTLLSAKLGAPALISLKWKNNLTSSITNMKLVLSLSGAVDPSSVEGHGGFYDSSKNQIIWSAQNEASLATVAPGAEGTLSFSFAPIPSSVRLLANPNAVLNLAVSAIRSDTQVDTPQEVVSAASATVRFSSIVALSAKALYSTGPYRNVGPVPPVAGQETTYSIVWSVSNSSNSLSNVRVSATLPLNVGFVGGDESVSYKDLTRTVSWNLGEVAAGTGYASPDRTTAFQVVITPSLSQKITAASLISAAHLTGNDRYTQTAVSADSADISTATIKD